MKSYEIEPQEERVDGVLKDTMTQDEQFEAIEAELIAHMGSDGFLDEEEEQESQLFGHTDHTHSNGFVEEQKGQLLMLTLPERASTAKEVSSSEDDEPIAQPRRRRFVAPTREQWLGWLPFIGVILLGALLRFWGLGDKPLHHDESLHAYYSWQLLLNIGNYQYNPLLHGPFQFHAIALVYDIARWLGVYDNGINTYTVRIPAATLGTLIIALPYFLRDYLGKLGAWLGCLLLAISPSLVYFSRFAREDIYMACFTLLLVVSAARYVRDRQMRWLVLAAVGFALSYATKEATFLTVIVFGSFMGALIVWELGRRWSLRPPTQLGLEVEVLPPQAKEPVSWGAKYLPKTAAPLLLVAYFLVVGLFGKWFLGYLKSLSVWITDPSHPDNMKQANVFVDNLKNITVIIVPWLGIILGVYVLSILWREMQGKLSLRRQSGLAARVDREQQPLLHTILTMPWTHWFFALLAALSIFLVLFTVLFTNIKAGIGDGIWQGLYYWLQQQQVARGGQPVYYYLMVIPLYEQIGVVFGVVGIIRCLVRPNPFRLFLVYWFLGNLVIYSWAAEKMPWLVIHMTMPLMLLGAVGLEPVVVKVIDLVKALYGRWTTERAKVQERPSAGTAYPRRRVGVFAGATAIVGFVGAVLLLFPTIQNMFQLSYVHAADGPHEMLIYVQTTTDVDTVMSKIDALDKQYYGGTHQLPIGLMNDSFWPFLWYLRDYPNLCLYYSSTSTSCPGPNGSAIPAAQVPAIIAGPNDIATAQGQLAVGGLGSSTSGTYMYHQYHLRTWWDQGYMPPACVPAKPGDCADASPWVGVGPWLWLSYGDNPPQGAKFNLLDLGLAAQNIWHWWWERRPFGATDGSSDMALLIRGGLSVRP